MRNKYSKNFENVMVSLAPTSSLNDLLWVARHRYHYKTNKNQLRQYLYKRQIRYKDYDITKVREMGKDKPLFSERVKDDGMVQIKISAKEWVYKQRYLYEKYHNEKLTENDYIIFLDQDRTNFDIVNLRKITRRESAIMANLKVFSSNPVVTETGIEVAKLITVLKDKEEEYETNNYQKRKTDGKRNEANQI